MCVLRNLKLCVQVDQSSVHTSTMYSVTGLPVSGATICLIDPPIMCIYTTYIVHLYMSPIYNIHVHIRVRLSLPTKPSPSIILCVDDVSHLWEAVFMLEYARSRGTNHQFMILLMKLYGHLGATECITVLFQALNIKHLQMDTLG